MSQSARVGSIESIQALHDALAAFGPEALEALGAAEIEIRRTFDHLNDQLKHWLRQTDRRREELNRAKADLAHARAIRQGQRSGYVEQEIAVSKATARLREAEEKVAIVKRWLLHLPQSVAEYEGPARRLAGLLDADLKQGLAVLENKVAALEAYAEMTAPASPPPPPPPPEPSPPTQGAT